jgi:hypothetical protein
MSLQIDKNDEEKCKRTGIDMRLFSFMLDLINIVRRFRYQHHRFIPLLPLF